MHLTDGPKELVEDIVLCDGHLFVLDPFTDNCVYHKLNWAASFSVEINP